VTKTQTARVVNATVRLDSQGGQGVLVPGGFILTATHCIKWNGHGGMAMGDHFTEAVTTKSGARFRLGPCAADPVSDMAVLGALDNQEFGEDCDEFERWCETTKPVPVATTTPRYRQPLNVRILTHKGEWISAKVVRYSHPSQPLHGCLCLEADAQIKGGTSGGPVVDSSGRLVGVVSNCGDARTAEKCVGMIPIAHLALPRWAWLLIGARPRVVEWQ
jgi:hypothetical protein